VPRTAASRSPPTSEPTVTGHAGIYLAMGKRSADLLSAMKDWPGRHNAVIMSVLCVVISANLLGGATGSLTA
jgi:hypothetical protein